MTELSKEEIGLFNKMVQSYWTENNITHIDNEEEWNLTLNLVKKLTIPVAVGQSEQFCECDGVQDLIAGTGECRKCGGQCTY